MKKFTPPWRVWKFNPVTGYWISERIVSEENKDEWLRVFQNYEPDARFKLSRHEPREKALSPSQRRAVERESNPARGFPRTMYYVRMRSEEGKGYGYVVRLASGSWDVTHRTFATLFDSRADAEKFISEQTPSRQSKLSIVSARISNPLRRARNPSRGSEIAGTILMQLGGNKFLTMTGARNLMHGENFLQFDLPRGARDGITRARIYLTPDDLYRMEFYQIRRKGLDTRLVAEFDGLYADQLQPVFKKVTGLDTHL